MDSNLQVSYWAVIGAGILFFFLIVSFIARKVSGDQSGGGDVLKMITWLLIAGGAGALGYFAIFFDTSAAVDGSMRVNNLGLMNTRTNGIIVSAVALIVGVLLALFGNRKTY